MCQAVLCHLVLFCVVWYYSDMGKYNGYTDARKKANKKYQDSLDSFSVRTTKEHGQAIRDAAKQAGQSLNQYVLDAIDMKMESDTTKADT